MSTPFMQLYVADYLGDTRHLTTEQHGAYLLLLMTMWRADGRLPNDAKKLARIAGCTPSRWSKISADVMEFFDVEAGEVMSRHLRHWDAEARRLAGRQPISASARALVFERDGYACTYCGDMADQLEVDHVVPVARGGRNSFENLVCACRACNRSKGSKLIEEWVRA